MFRKVLPRRLPCHIGPDMTLSHIGPELFLSHVWPRFLQVLRSRPLFLPMFLLFLSSTKVILPGLVLSVLLLQLVLQRLG